MRKSYHYFQLKTTSTIQANNIDLHKYSALVACQRNSTRYATYTVLGQACRNKKRGSTLNQKVNIKIKCQNGTCRGTSDAGS